MACSLVLMVSYRTRRCLSCCCAFIRAWRSGAIQAAGVFFFSSRRRHTRSEEHTSELQSRSDIVCRLLLEKKKKLSCVPPPISCKADINYFPTTGSQSPSCLTSSSSCRRRHHVSQDARLGTSQ